MNQYRIHEHGRSYKPIPDPYSRPHSVNSASTFVDRTLRGESGRGTSPVLEANVGTASLVYCLYLGKGPNAVIRSHTWGLSESDELLA